MNNQEAIKELSEWLDGCCGGEEIEPTRQALRLAISALQAQEAKTQLSEEGTTTKVKKTCITCKHYPPESKFPCIDCDMRNPADRWEPQELSKNSTELDKENGDLQPTCNELATDTISRKEAIDGLEGHYIERINLNDWQSGWNDAIDWMKDVYLDELPSAQPEPLVKESRTLVKDLVKDTISRKEAIEVADAVWCVTGDVNVAKVWDQLKNLPSAQPEIIRCKDCRWRKDQSGSTAWLPCRAIVTPSDFYCGRAERRTDD